MELTSPVKVMWPSLPVTLFERYCLSPLRERSTLGRGWPCSSSIYERERERERDRDRDREPEREREGRNKKSAFTKISRT